MSASEQREAELEKTIVEMQNWNAESERYKLTEFTLGQFAYALKEELHASEPAHMICANCYQNLQKSILQSLHVGPFGVCFDMIKCQRCNSTFGAHMR